MSENEEKVPSPNRVPDGGEERKLPPKGGKPGNPEIPIKQPPPKQQGGGK